MANTSFRAKKALGIIFCLVEPQTLEPAVWKHLDLRAQQLQEFFSWYGCPPTAVGLADHYVRAADTYQIDWRLLPVIAILESSCMRQYAVARNNAWGWDGGSAVFPSLPVGIDHISRELAQAPQYTGKTIEGKVNVYNSHPAYGKQIKRLMRMVDKRNRASNKNRARRTVPD